MFRICRRINLGLHFHFAGLCVLNTSPQDRYRWLAHGYIDETLYLTQDMKCLVDSCRGRAVLYGDYVYITLRPLVSTDSDSSISRRHSFKLEG